MNRSISVTRSIVLVAGAVQVVLGGLFWAGIGRTLVPLHIGVGLVLVLSLWLMAFLAARARSPIGLVILVAVWSAILPVVGIGQGEVLHGSLHWIVEVVHLLLGLGAIGIAVLLAGKALPRKAVADRATVTR